MIKTKFLIAATISFGLAGCGAMGSNTSLYSANQPVVERTNFAIDVNANGSSGIAPGEKVRVGEWMNALQLGYGDRVSVDYGAGYANNTIKNEVAQMAAERGMLIADTAPVTPGAVAPGTVRIVVTRSSASVPGCPNWSKSTEANYNSSTHPNYGCAVNSTMAAMIADPEDLVRGKENEKLDSSSGKNAIQAYRTKTGDQ
ncbi:CpaD family pilus assembly protein [Sphingorhabdus arenilitoris]|uniref:CpaD family pilus assembly protein n=1 Tax=Sphingorhabdus arenilitoris TaxID=1490041 RepID=A0ABV8REQ6_9SPHN